MKIRLIALITLLSLALVACSLAEDITPPPGYVSPTPPPTIAPSTPTTAPQPSSTPVLSTPTAVATSAEAIPSTATTPEVASPTFETSATPGVQTGAVTGTVVTGSGAALPAGLTVILRGFEQDQGGSPQEVVNLSMPVPPDGAFKFENVEIPEGRIFISQVEYNGIPYQSNYVIASKDIPMLELSPVTIYEATQDLNVLQVEQVHIVLDFSTPDSIQVIELYIMTNPSQQAAVVPTDRTSIPFVKLPVGAIGVSFQVANGSAPFIGTGSGFALLPGPAEQKYGLVAIFNLPYAKKLELTQPFVLPVASVTVFAPEGVKLRGDQLTDKGTQDFQGTTYHLYEAQNLVADDSLKVTISGQPKKTSTSSGVSSSSRIGLVIGLSVFGLAFIAAGIWLFVRDRRRAKEEEEEGEDEDTETAEDALGDDRDSLMDAIIALDDQFKAGGISEEAYHKHRDELKAKLREQI